MKQHEIQTWNGCFGSSWEGALTAESFRHPGKFSRELAVRIVRFCLEKGYWKKDDLILDPFAGVGCGGLICALEGGLRWLGVELEKRYFDEAEKNFYRHREHFRRFNDPYPLIIHGDSRNLSSLLSATMQSQGLQGMLASPPYGDALRDQGCNEGTGAHGEQHRRGRKLATSDAGLPDTPGQLANLTYRPFKRCKPVGIFSSPPYASTELNQTGNPEQRAHRMRRQGLSEKEIQHTLSNAMSDHYGDSTGQLCLSSEADFWSASSDILKQCYKALRKNSVSVFVVKAFVRNRRIVDFPAEWADCLRSCGFKVFLEVQAKLVQEDRHPCLFGGEVVSTSDNKSFFKRLHDKKYPDTAVNHETVWFAQK